MENASKALIIAGAILLSILIIGLGMAVYNNASSTTGSANLNGQEVSAHNSKFEAYEGTITGSQLRTLVNAVKSNNKEYEDRTIEIDGKEASGIDVSKIKNNKKYTVKFHYDDENSGVIDNIIVTPSINQTNTINQ